ncbi:metallophosphoesterase [Natrialba taiwanensis DSM 12281]|uniref:Metallophosphoesterase n=2 Tax=Natrialba taiwanensis TaxID=160846 RepID=L9ZE92_9EURY|nr:metallophosphoesterase [Natrialba taiwanensis DSM 12281]
MNRHNRTEFTDATDRSVAGPTTTYIAGGASPDPMPPTLDNEYVSDWRVLAGDSAVDADDSDTDSDGDADELTVAHVSDLHGQLTPRHHVYYDTLRSNSRAAFEFGDADELVKRAGGIPILSAKLGEIRSAADATLTLMSGDTFHGSAVATYGDGRDLCDLVADHLGPDVYVPGNWDVADESSDDGALREYLDRLETRGTTVLANNLYDAGTTDSLYDPYTIIERNGISVGVVGMTNVYMDRMAPALHEDKYEFGKHPALLEAAAREAKADGAELVIAVTEIGLQWMVQAAKDCPSIDVALSSHTHEYTHEPIVVDGTVVVESGMGDALGRLDIRRIGGNADADADADADGGDKDGADTKGDHDAHEFAVRHVLYCLAPDHEYTPDPDAAAHNAIERVREPFLADDPEFEQGHGTLEQPLDTVVGETATRLARRSFLVNSWNAALTDALVEFTGADLAVVNGYRFGFAVPPGEITLDDCYGAFPMISPVATGDAYGKQLANHVEASLNDNFSPHVYEQENGRVRSFSPNVSLTIDPTAKRERRLVAFTIDGEPIDPDDSYTVAALDKPGSAARELGGCNFPSRNVEIEEGTTAVDVLVEYLADESPLDIDTDGLVTTPDDGGTVQNTPADGPYPFVQPGVDYAGGEKYCETRLIPDRYAMPDEAVNRRR